MSEPCPGTLVYTPLLDDGEEYFERDDAAFITMRAVTARLDENRIPYAVAGGLAMVAHGYPRKTPDVDILVRPADIPTIRRELAGARYNAVFPRAKYPGNTSISVKVDFLHAGRFPGDGKPKPYCFPDPKDIAVEIDGIPYLSLASLLEIKLACSLSLASNPKHPAHVRALIRALKLGLDFAERLHPYLRGTYRRIWLGLWREPTAAEIDGAMELIPAEIEKLRRRMSVEA